MLFVEIEGGGSMCEDDGRVIVWWFLVWRVGG